MPGKTALGRLLFPWRLSLSLHYSCTRRRAAAVPCPGGGGSALLLLGPETAAAFRGAVRLTAWAKATGKSAADIAKMRDGGIGWGQIAHALNQSPGIRSIMGG